MPVEKVNTLVVGAGQAGVAMSEHLSKCGVEHLVLERSRIAERWRSERWDSLVANGPAWHDRFPGLEFTKEDPDSFVPKERVADYFEAYAAHINAPIRCGVEVTKVERKEGAKGFVVETSDGVIEANHIVAATGPFQRPIYPQLVPQDSGIRQMHSKEYKNPDQLPEGAVLVVGAGSSGVQIADELQRAGKKVYLSVGPHERFPRVYRGYDYCWWLGVLGMWDDESVAPGKEHVAISVSGAYGGQTIDFRRLAADGMTLVGRTEGFDNGVMRFASDLQGNIAQGDESYLDLLNMADDYAAKHGLDLPEEPDARTIGEDPECLINPVLELDTDKAGISTIIWATGFALDYGWLQVDAFDADGKPQHKSGVSSEPGVYFLGLPWLTRRGSSFIYGVWHDAKHVADHISIQEKYGAYQPPASRLAPTS